MLSCGEVELFSRFWLRSTLTPASSAVAAVPRYAFALDVSSIAGCTHFETLSVGCSCRLSIGHEPHVQDQECRKQV